MRKSNAINEPETPTPTGMKIQEIHRSKHSRHKSHNGFMKSLKSYETDKQPKPSQKLKFGLKNLFKKHKDKNKALVKKIDKFADENISRAINLKKLKKRDSYFDSLEFAQPRSMSRTFTGNYNSRGEGSLRLTDAFNMSSPLDFNTPESPPDEENKTSLNFIGDADSEGDHEGNELEHSVSRIGDFYEGVVKQRNVAILERKH